LFSIFFSLLFKKHYFFSDLLITGESLCFLALFLFFVYGSGLIKRCPLQLSPATRSNLLCACLLVATAGACLAFTGLSIFGSHSCEDRDDNSCNELHGTGFVESTFYVPCAILITAQTVLNFQQLHSLIACWVMIAVTLVLFIVKFGIAHAMADISILLLLSFVSVVHCRTRKATYIANGTPGLLIIAYTCCMYVYYNILCVIIVGIVL
jgi:hypothetical protein